MRVLLVENYASQRGPPIGDSRISLTRANNADDGLSLMRQDEFDLVLVDLTSLFENGFAFIRRLRSAENHTPVIALASNDSTDRVRALGLGADDAIANPVDADELEARIQAIVRRHRGHRQPLVQAGDLSLFTDMREVRLRDKLLKLTDKEYSMLELLILRGGRTITKEMFLNHLYGGVDEPEAKIIDVFICKLRRKLDDAGAIGLIHTVWGHGYTLRDPTRTQPPTDPDTYGAGPVALRLSSPPGHQQSGLSGNSK